eukprot:m.314747 g.314747  ORF g.314747 m.314747 type:complete len:65 (+) comp55422_c1_seq6:398-592(+)
MQPHDRSPSRALLARDSKYKATSSQHDDELTGIADSYLVDLSDQHARGQKLFPRRLIKGKFRTA